MSFDLRDSVARKITARPAFHDLANKGHRFVGWYVHRIHDASPLDAVDSLIDGARDKQIDVIYIDQDMRREVRVQGKYFETGSVSGKGRSRTDEWRDPPFPRGVRQRLVSVHALYPYIHVCARCRKPGRRIFHWSAAQRGKP